jgi:CBS domain containing-hemolysin-like protein
VSAWLFLVLGALVSAAGVLSGVAASAVRRVDLYRWAATPAPDAQVAERLLAAPDRIVRASKAGATIGILVSGAAAASIVAALPLPMQAAVVVLVLVPMTLAVAYAVPRAIGRRWPERLIGRTVPMLSKLSAVLAPLRPRPLEARMRRDVEGDADGEESVDHDELTVLSGVLAFTERPVREVMTPRTDLVAAPEGASVEEVGRMFTESGYSRIPVYRDSLDNIVGMIYAFDLLKVAPGADLPVRPIATAPGSKRCAELLFEMQRDRRQIAVVLDEYGGTAGLVTFEDLLEELVGEIFDEHDGLPGTEEVAPQLVEANGSTPVDEIAQRFEVEFPEAAETVSGLLTRLGGRIPIAGERFFLAGLEFDVLESTPNRLERVLIRRGPVGVVSLDRRSVT